MHAHHLVAWLLQQGGRIAIDFPQFTMTCLEAAALITRAQHFEAGDTASIDAWLAQLAPAHLPAIQPFSVAGDGGRLLLPFDQTYLEYDIALRYPDAPDQPAEPGSVMVLAARVDDLTYLKMFFRNNATREIWDAYMGARVGEDEQGHWIEYAVGAAPDEDTPREVLIEELAALLQIFTDALWIISLPGARLLWHPPEPLPQGAAAGALPTFGWHTLVLHPDRVLEMTPHGGHHAPPRAHLRRQHLRHLAGGRIVTVRACVVGDPTDGALIKDYRLGRPGPTA